MILTLVLFLAVSNLNLDMMSVPLSTDLRVPMISGGRLEMKREGTVTRIRIEMDRVAAPSMHGPVYNTYVVWAVSPEGILDNLGELDVNGTKGQFNGTTRLGELGVLITAEPHYMVDRPSAAVAYRAQPPQDPRRKNAVLQIGTYDYSMLKPTSSASLHGSAIQARMAFQIAQSVGADRLAPKEFRNAQVAAGALEELIMRLAPLDIVWPIANEAIRWSERAAEVARQSH
jgi:hypothetical protein